MESTFFVIVIMVMIPAIAFLFLQQGVLDSKLKRLEEKFKKISGEESVPSIPAEPSPSVVKPDHDKPIPIKKALKPVVTKPLTKEGEYYFSEKIEDEKEVKIDEFSIQYQNLKNNHYVAHFFSGNPIAKIGMFILFIGVAFLLKLVAAYIYIPIGYRFIAAGLLGFFLMIGSLSLFDKHRTYAGILAGGGASILYLTIFTANQMYGLLSPFTALSSLVTVVILASLLAVHRNVRVLMIMSSIGGFLAPLIIQSGSHDIFVLFSYYLILNVAITLIIFRKQWVELAFIGFLFTFIVSALWYNFQYEIYQYLRTQLFLVAFFALYLINTSIIRAQCKREPLSRVESFLLFATPVMFFILQSRLMLPYEYGQAISALAIAGVYVVLAGLTFKELSLIRLRVPFFGIALLFFTISIPLIFSLFWVFTCWALEAVLLIWYGSREKYIGLEVSGLIILSLANFLLLMSLPSLTQGFWQALALSIHNNLQLSLVGQHPLCAAYVRWVVDGINAMAAYDVLSLWKIYTNSIVISLANIICAYFIAATNRNDNVTKNTIEQLLVFMGIVFWYQANIYQIYRFISFDELHYYLLTFVITTHLILWLSGERLGWGLLRLYGLGLLPVLVVTSVWTSSHEYHMTSPCILLFWFYGFATLYYMLYRSEYCKQKTLGDYHVATFLFLTAFLTHRTILLSKLYHVSTVLPDFVMAGIVPAIMLIFVITFINRPTTVFHQYKQDYQYRAGTLLAGYLMAWLLLSNFNGGYATYLPYLPLLNVLDVSIIIVLYCFQNWFKDASKVGTTFSPTQIANYKWYLAILIFAFINAVLLRTLSHWEGIPYDWNKLWGSIHVQTCLSVLWTIIALITTFAATRCHRRDWWFIGFQLIAVVIVKLFMVDLSHSNTMERVITFMVVGVLLLINGYISPLPPKKQDDKDELFKE